MTHSELAAICMSARAVLASITAIHRQSGFASRQLELEEKQAELADLQRQQMEAERLADSKAFIDLDLRVDGADARLIIRNSGRADAEEVDLVWNEQPPPFPQYEAERKLPIPLLRAGKQVELVVAFTMGTSPDYDVDATWIDPDGSTRTESHILHAY